MPPSPIAHLLSSAAPGGLRILHVIPSLSPAHGGPSAAMPALERALTAAGVIVETATTDDGGPGKRNPALSATSPIQENRVTRHYFSKQSEFYKVSLPFARWIQRHVRDYDLVHIHALFSFTSVAAARAARKADVPYIVRPLGVLNRYGITQRRTLLKKLSLRFLESSILRYAAAVHFTHDAERAEADQLSIRLRAEVIPLPLEPFERAAPSATESPPYVLFLSRIDPKKNLDAVVDAWAKVSSHHPEWQLRIAGDGEPHYIGRLRSRARTAGLNGSVQWTGRVDGPNKSDLLFGASLFVLPSHSENFGIAGAEALMAGVPCIFSRHVPVGLDAAAQDAAVVAASDPQSLASAINRLIEEPDRRADLSRRARAFAETQFSPKAIGARLRALYERVLAAHGRK